MAKDPFNATLVERQDLTAELAIFRVRADAPVKDFIPGQYTTLGLYQSPEEAAKNPPSRTGKDNTKPKLILRAYSIASSPTVRDEHVEFFLVVVDDGELTPKLWQLKEGD
ncbi:MAG: hypothetical protein WD009_05840, partial [Phycisphaeraceae bacterium]